MIRMIRLDFSNMICPHYFVLGTKSISLHTGEQTAGTGSKKPSYRNNGAWDWKLGDVDDPNSPLKQHKECSSFDIQKNGMLIFYFQIFNRL